MKKIFIIICLLCLSITEYSQSKVVKENYLKPAKALFTDPITKSNLSKYEYFTYNLSAIKIAYDRGRDGKKNIEVLEYIEKRAGDSVKVYHKRAQETLLKNNRLKQVADSIRQDSIQRIKVAEEIKRAQIDSQQRTKQQDFFSIESIVENIGTDAYSKENIENSLHIYPVGYQGTSTFYELNDMFITIKFVGLEDIAVELGFRLFGEDASFYKKELMRAGFKYQKTFRETMIENHSQGYSNLSGAEIQRYRKFTGKEYVICDIFYERFTFFKIYRARYKK